MATLLERLEADYKTAMKTQERLRIDTLRLLKAAIQRVAIDKRKDTLEEQEVIQVLNQQAKQRRETMEAATQTHRQDVLSQATNELAILTSYLPTPLSMDAVNQLIEEAVKTVGANPGQIMKFVMGKGAGRVDGKTVSQLVGQRLQQAS